MDVHDAPGAIAAARRDLVNHCRVGRAPRGGPRYLATIERAYAALCGAPPAPRAAAPAAAIDERVALWRDAEGARPSRAEVRAWILRSFTPGGRPKSGRRERLRVTLAAPDALPRTLALGLPVFPPCPVCHGDGHVAGRPCRACDRGLAEREADVVVRVDGPGVAATVVEPLEAVGIDTIVIDLRVVAA
ncbi:MAG: hypothetical protein D6689_10070 [Deltaproteobacteria bacterium]|nr:MAG: hypothetical protein D6689_10070 [Deltaproteobacteria bacterium]